MDTGLIAVNVGFSEMRAIRFTKYMVSLHNKWPERDFGVSKMADGWCLIVGIPDGESKEQIVNECKAWITGNN